MPSIHKHILAVTSQNNPGVLSRIAGVLRRKLFNIDSLTVGRTQTPNVSRFTIVIVGEEGDARKAARALEKLVEIIDVEILPEESLTREIVLARLNVETGQDEALLKELEEDIIARTLLRRGDEVIVELIDTSQKLDALLERLQNSPIEVLEWVRSGIIAIEKPFAQER